MCLTAADGGQPWSGGEQGEGDGVSVGVHGEELDAHPGVDLAADHHGLRYYGGHVA